MKNLLLAVLVLGSVSEVMAFEVKASVKNTRSYTDENCNSLSRGFVEDTTIEAQAAVMKNAQSICKDKLAERVSDYSIKTNCSYFGPFYSVTKLSMEASAEYECN